MKNKRQTSQQYQSYAADILTHDLKCVRAIFHLVQDLITISEQELIALSPIKSLKIISIRKLKYFEFIY